MSGRQQSVATQGASPGQESARTDQAPGQQSSESGQSKLPPGKGPLVFLHYDQRELDAAYDQGLYARNAAQVIKRYAANSDATRARIGSPRRYAYGQKDIERLDVYSTKRGNAPVFIFIHGGAWRAGSAKDYAFPAQNFIAAGAHFVVLDFAAVQDAGGNLLVMADQVRRAIAWVYMNAASFGADRERLFIGGHSSGGHLAAVCAVTDWEKEFDLPPDLIKGGLCSSGMYDLEPVRLSARSSYVNFTDYMEQALSAQRHIDKLCAPLIVTYGTCETPEFQRQARDFVSAVTAAGKQAELIVGESYNHFEMPETLASPYGLLGEAALRQMGLTNCGMLE
jgi:arylformamidase